MKTDHQELTGRSPIVLVIHGGAGAIPRDHITSAQERRYKRKLDEALLAGYSILAAGGTALAAVEAAVKVMEDSPLFNAGRGAVFTREGRIELDAAIMDGASRKAGAVAAVTIVKNPISAARAVMELTPHVLLVCKGANSFARKVAREAGLKIVDPSYFWTSARWALLKRTLEEEKEGKRVRRSRAKAASGSEAIQHTRHAEVSPNRKENARIAHRERLKKFGTVGAVALDVNGNVAAATSTGGTNAKQYGRVGDSPIIGAGTYADNNTCAVSATGHGEFFIRYAAAYDVAALMKYRGMALNDAADRVVNETLREAGGEGGIIAVDASGNFAMPFNTEGMFRGYIRGDGEPHSAIFRD